MPRFSAFHVFIVIAGLLIVSLLAFMFLDSWDNKALTEANLPTVEALAEEIAELDTYLLGLEESLADQNLSLARKDQLLEEKNLQLTFMGAKVKEVEAAHAASKAEMEQLKKQLFAARRKLNQAIAGVEQERLLQGLVYRVQIGTLKGEALPPPASWGAHSVEGIAGQQKYIVGYFSAYETALAYRDFYRRLGVKDAWVVSYLDGVRVGPDIAQAYLMQQKLEGQH